MSNKKQDNRKEISTQTRKFTKDNKNIYITSNGLLYLKQLVFGGIWTHRLDTNGRASNVEVTEASMLYFWKYQTYIKSGGNVSKFPFISCLQNMLLILQMKLLNGLTRAGEVFLLPNTKHDHIIIQNVGVESMMLIYQRKSKCVNSSVSSQVSRAQNEETKGFKFSLKSLRTNVRKRFIYLWGGSWW